MTPELYIQLKKAGFPFFPMSEETLQDGGYLDDDAIELDEEYYYVPTLKDYILQCGDSFSALHKTFSGWLADGKNKTETSSTPEGAVARLWLALHSHD